MNDGHLAALGRFHELPVGSGIQVCDVGLFIVIVGKHPVVYLGALVAGRTTGRLDVRLIRRRFDRLFVFYRRRLCYPRSRVVLSGLFSLLLGPTL